MSSNTVKIGNLFFEVDNTGPTADQTRMYELLLVARETCKANGIFSGALDHNIADHTVHVRVDYTHDEPATVLFDPVPTLLSDGTYRASEITIVLNPSLIDATQIYSPETDTWNEAIVLEVLMNEFGAVAGAVNPNLEIPGGPGTGPNTVFGYPFGGGDPDLDWRSNKGPMETFGASVEDFAHDMYDQPQRTAEWIDGVGNTARVNDPSALIGNDTEGNRPIWSTLEQHAAGLRNAKAFCQEPEGGDSDAEDTDTYADPVLGLTTAATNEGSPLVLDIDGDGIELTSLNSTDAVYWGHNLNGFASIGLGNRR